MERRRSVASHDRPKGRGGKIEDWKESESKEKRRGGVHFMQLMMSVIEHGG